MRKYLLDENVGESLRKGLHAHYPRVSFGASAIQQFRQLERRIRTSCCGAKPTASRWSRITVVRCLIICTIILRRHFPGMFTLNPKMAISETIEELALIWGASSLDEYADQINYLPLRW